MPDAGFPNAHTTTTTITSNTRVQTNIRYDPKYIKTKGGILKIVQIVLNLLGFICIQCSGFPGNSRGSFFDTVSMTGFWFTGILLLFYLFHVIEKLYKIPWLKIEFFYCFVMVCMYLICSCLAATFGVEGYAVAAFFGFCAMVAYGLDTFLKYKAIRSGEIAQGEREVQKQTTTVTTPAY
ncbi:CKLF-like MARVEL transmembrane domain-containing protein 4 [Agrilus planipennis]|uniref:CKLF-like MARVEL transmembrane domain-containing protein 4 n=1 Tax=Agrilus planipennis TaxID=224129 RepID=A0A1W4W5Z0_AGRPL|nr:CKLF-like MARVEL transmembrane domain-containing protein 4 [Agrilus planipennis]XP_018319525.1 CKLF-like MARVEL transmembrane domain-containing protein 4 [Agrilus planipennis]